MATILSKDSALHFPHVAILDASAGSGKTTALTQRLAQFLLSDRIPHNQLRSILAITFTNLAATEMKQRVLKLLKKAALGDKDTLEDLRPLLALKDEELKRRAEAALQDILENYSEFQVTTIDSFLSRVFKASALEFGFPPDFDIVLASGPLIDEAFETFARGVSKGSEAAKLLSDLVEVLLESRDGKIRYPWNPYADLAARVKELYSRIVLTALPLNQEDVRGEMHGIAETMAEQIRELDQKVKASRLPVNTRFEPYVTRVRSGRIDQFVSLKLPDPPVNKTGAMPSRYQAFLEETKQLREELKKQRSRLVTLWSVNYFQPYLTAHRLLQETLENVKRRRGLVDLADLSGKLAGFIDQGIVPEIYLSLGDRIWHFLIDEFQDTSPVQWKSLRPLIDNSLASGGSMFVVGDMKQSIYAFRGADWRIMKSLLEERVFDSVPTPAVRRLEVNYRSGERILNLSKEVFHTIVPLQVTSQAERLSGLATFKQEVHESLKGKGYAEVLSIAGDTEERPEKIEILRIVDDCLARGHSLRDIAILTQDNEAVIQISGWLNEAGKELIPYSTLDIRTRKVVQEILALQRFLDSPIDDLAFATFLLGDLFRAVLDQRSQDIPLQSLRDFIFEQRRKDGPRRALYTLVREHFPGLWKEYFEELLGIVGYLPLYDLTSDILKHFRVFECVGKEEAALTKLLEVVKNFEERGENTLKDFLRFSEEDSEDADWNIAVPPDVDAIKVMTIHKAKGLGFRVVLVLLYDVRGRADRYYMHESGDGVTLMQLTKKLSEDSDELAALYVQKELRTTVDELNKLYVAFTRAEVEMYLLSVKYDKEPKPSSYLPVSGYEAKEKPPLEPRETKKALQSAVYHTTIMKRSQVQVPENLAVEEMQRGELLHGVLARVLFLEGDVQDTVRASVEAELKLHPNEVGASLLAETITAFFGGTGIREYFEKREGRTVLNEQEFVRSDGSLVRMDRVVFDSGSVTVIDYKTGEENEVYAEQVGDYVAILKEIYTGKAVKGVLAYVDQKILKDVH